MLFSRRLSAFRETSFLDTFRRDPRHAAFWFARYKFVAKMLAGHKRVLEVGCGNGFAGAIVGQAVKLLVQTDVAPLRESPAEAWNPLEGRYKRGRFTAAYALDVLEHVEARDEDDFIEGISASLETNATCVVGMPSLESQAYASEASRTEHRNCKTEQGLRELMARHFSCVYMFGMNDEVVHTGFHAMCHYRLALCNTPLGIAPPVSHKAKRKLTFAAL